MLYICGYTTFVDTSMSFINDAASGWYHRTTQRIPYVFSSDKLWVSSNTSTYRASMQCTWTVWFNQRYWIWYICFGILQIVYFLLKQACMRHPWMLCDMKACRPDRPQEWCHTRQIILSKLNLGERQKSHSTGINPTTATFKTLLRCNSSFIFFAAWSYS